MIVTHNLGYPRIGKQRELKFALEAYWRGDIAHEALEETGAALRKAHWQEQATLDWVPVGDFSFYDQVLDMSVTLGNWPDRVKPLQGKKLDNYFRIARGRTQENGHEGCCTAVAAGEMTKWFDTNYHYIVPEFSASTTFSLDASRLLEQWAEAGKVGVRGKPVILGPLTYLALGKMTDSYDKLCLLQRLLPVYVELLTVLAQQGATWVQIDEPILVTELEPGWADAFKKAYGTLAQVPVNLLLTTYFGQLLENRELVAELPVAGVHVEALAGYSEVEWLNSKLSRDQVLSVGVIDGRNVWKSDLNALLDRLEPLAAQRADRLWLAPSCSLLHVPVDLASETRLDPEIRAWLAFAVQKISELNVLAKALNEGRDSVREILQENQRDCEARRTSRRVRNDSVRQAVEAVAGAGSRENPYPVRAAKQAERLRLPRFPTTTIGSFPQTGEIRRHRRAFRNGQIDNAEYRRLMEEEIARCIRVQEELGLDVLVHGEAERNDMVEYFGEQLLGYVISEAGWVQSYGSRCVKPPILYGDIQRPQAITVEWTRYAQSLTGKPVKGMLTGPVTLLNWSFVRDDLPRADICRQLALAIRDEVQELEAAGVAIIQIDEAALREGLPLRRSEWKAYLQWAIDAFRLCANGVRDETQIHTHMCYSEFNDIMESIARMDADVITIETSRSNMELLDAFENFHYPNAIGPGVYDIHSPNIPDEKQIVTLMQQAATRIPAERLWVNPDCGLKTRQWPEVIPALQNMVSAARQLRTQVTEEACEPA